MLDAKRVLSSVLLVGGVALVFSGVSAALGFGASGTIAAVAAVAALLYAGAVWFGSPAPPQPVGPSDPVLVFDRALRLVGGATNGRPVTAEFPAALRRDVERCCAAALAGESSHFTCDVGRSGLAFDAAPIRTASGAIAYGVLINAAVGRNGAYAVTTAGLPT